MNNCNVIYRKAVARDDLGTIAKYLHLTDPYIYPAICTASNSKYWESIVSACFFSDNNIFSKENMIVAEANGKIVGILNVIACGKPLRFIEDISDELPLTPELIAVNTGYFQPLLEESLSFDGYNITNI